jgi:hypothetical protein
MLLGLLSCEFPEGRGILNWIPQEAGRDPVNPQSGILLSCLVRWTVLVFHFSEYCYAIRTHSVISMVHISHQIA